MSGIRSVAVVGSGLAAELAATALGRRLAGTARVVFVRTGEAPDTDRLYGTVAGPWAKALHDRIGVAEGALLRAPATALSWGTRYEGWGAGRPWLQCHHQPFRAVGGVDLQHVLTRLGLPLQPLLVPAVAAAAGAFAHPSPDPASPLSRAEYGYQFDPAALSAVLAEARPASVEVRRAASLDAVRTGEAGIEAVTLEGGETVEADLFVDATGPAARLASALGLRRRAERSVAMLTSRHAPAALAPYRTLAAAPFGWTATTPLRGGVLRQTLFRPDEAAQARRAHGEDGDEARAEIGRAEAPWLRNCVAIGHAAGIADPLTSAPLLLLYRDVSRLLALVPLDREARVERREYARRFGEDTEHAGLFAGAFFAEGGLTGEGPPDTAYRREARAADSPKLARKLAQFESRGVLVPYDLEPFGPEDWLILHEGMGRRSRRHDPLADRLPEAALRRELEGQRAAIAALARRMPPAGQYLARYLDYLERNP